MVETGWGHNYTARASMEVLCFLAASFAVMLTFHGQQKPQILVHVTSFCGFISKIGLHPPLKKLIGDEIQYIPGDMLRRAMADVRDRV
jgi:hypothetical protein